MQLPKRKPGKYSQTDHDPHMTQKKYNELEIELGKLKKRRPKLAAEVSRLAELGDFSENVEYQQAKRKLRGTLSAITRIEAELNAAIVITSAGGDVVQLGSTVTFLLGEKEKTYTILGSSEAAPQKNIISHNSPLGEALLGHSVGDVFDVKIAGKLVSCTIISIQ